MRRYVILTIPILLMLPEAGWVYGWDKDMVDQPSEKAQESIAPPGPGSIPTDGGEIVPQPRTDEEFDEMKDAAAAIVNPVPADASSIARGNVFYDTNCFVCHGKGGLGDGPVGLMFLEKAPVDLNEPYTQDQADGQLFFTLTRGRAKMPFYRDALSQSERWDVVNYVRSAFGDVSVAKND
jgi:mono/diheme cytochrome c family protein